MLILFSSSPFGRGFQAYSSPSEERFPNLSLSLWERSGEGFHIALHSYYAGGVPSPNLPLRGRDYK